MDPFSIRYDAGRITRGGDITTPNSFLTVFNRVRVGTADKTRYVGFRIVVTVK